MNDPRYAMALSLMNGDLGASTVDEVAALFNLPAAALPAGDWVLRYDVEYDALDLPAGLSFDAPVLVDDDGDLCVAGFENCGGPNSVLFYFRFRAA